MLDVGTHSTAPVDYPDSAEAVGKAVLRRRGRAGRADLRQRRRAPRWRPTSSPASGPPICHDVYSAHQGVEHDDMNVLVLGGRVIGPGPGPGAGARVRGRALHAARSATCAASRR